MMLADISAADPKHVQDVLVILMGIVVALVGIASVAIQWMNSRKSVQTQVQQPLVIQWGEMDRRVSATENAIMELRRDLKTDREKQDRDAEERARRIYERMELVREGLENRISELPSQLVALLKNTGAIK